jgi:hypothetical protein
LEVALVEDLALASEHRRNGNMVGKADLLLLSIAESAR